MKKKIFLGVLALFAFTMFVSSVNAAPLFNVRWKDVRAKSPDLGTNNNLILPTTNIVGTTTTDNTDPGVGEFDFSPVIFSTSTGGTTHGKVDMQKIIVGERGTITGNASATKGASETYDAYVKRLINNYFTGYCLDENKKYPQFGLFNSSQYERGATNDYATLSDAQKRNLLLSVVLASMMNDTKFNNVITKLITEYNNDLSSIQPVNEDGSIYAETINGEPIEDFYSYFMNGTGSEVNLGLAYIGFYEFGDLTKKVFFASTEAIKNDVLSAYPGSTVYYLTGDSPASDTLVPLNTKLADLAFQKYKVGNTNDYIHALWIVENSYPTLTVDETLSLVGVTKEAFDTRIKALYGNSVNLEEYEDMVLFSIIQYAVWKSVGTNVAGEKLGGEITNAAEFNTIYKYYIDEGKVPANYNTPSSYSSKIDFVAPAKGKEKYDKHQDAKIDFYGPFSATYTAIYDSSMKINYAIDNNDKKAVKLYTADFKEITGTTVDKDQVFFIGVANNQEIKNVKINFTKTGITTFYPVENRGKIYSPIMGISQNVLVGGRAAQKNITGTITMDIVGNPKTGIQNIALLLLVTLIAFTLGYMVLSYKQKPIQLQQ